MNIKNFNFKVYSNLKKLKNNILFDISKIINLNKLKILEINYKYGTLSKADQKTGELTFDSTTKDVEPELLAQITPMEVNKVSEPIAITDRKTYETVYYVVKVTKKDAKKESWKDYETILKDYIINKKASDKNYAKQVVAELLKEYKVEVKDEAFKNVIEQYLNHKNTETTETSETSSTTEAK